MLRRTVGVGAREASATTTTTTTTTRASTATVTVIATEMDSLLSTSTAETPLLLDADREDTTTTAIQQDGGVPLESSLPSTPNMNRQQRFSYFRRMGSLLASPVTGDEQPGGIVAGFSLLCLVGCMLGACLPKNPALPTVAYRWVSSCIGYTYFLCWSVSFYPQAITNYKRKTTDGLSADFSGLNVLGFACYTAYNLGLFCSSQIQQQYRDRHSHDDGKITVQSNDVAFAVHAFLLSTVTFFQIGYYDGFRTRPPSQATIRVICGVLLVILMTPLLVVFHVFEWLDYLYLLSYIKICITLVKYMPQVALNVERQSTQGWSIWQILLDFSGGMLSDLQLVLDCLDLHDFTGITGNLAKLILGLASISFDTVFMLQHYVWYRRHPSPATLQEAVMDDNMNAAAATAEIATSTDVEQDMTRTLL